jgi:hypothetical protein
MVDTRYYTDEGEEGAKAKVGTLVKGWNGFYGNLPSL